MSRFYIKKKIILYPRKVNFQRSMHMNLFICYIYYLVFKEYSFWNARDNTLPFWACFWAVNSEAAARENCSTFNNDEDVIQGGNSATSIFQATNWILWKIGFGRHHHQKFLCSKFEIWNPPWLSHIFRIFDRANKMFIR